MNARRATFRRGWLRREQASEALRDGGPLIEVCRRKGWLDASRARRLRECAPGRGDPEPGEDPHRVGDVIAGRYRIEEIFRGGFGRVFLCRQRDGSRAALKTLLRKHLEDARIRQMFLDEARLSMRPGTANTSRPCSMACRAEISAPDRSAASTTMTPSDMPVMIRLR